MMPKSTATMWPSGSTNRLPGCMSAWKKPSRSAWRRKVCIRAAARCARSRPLASIAARSESGVASIHSSVSTSLAVRSQSTAGTRKSGSSRVFSAISEMAENTRDDPDFRVPAVDWDLTAKDVLTLEWIDATPLSDRAAIEASGLDLAHLAAALMQTFLRHALRDGFFHADMHPGNLFVDAAGTLTFVDFGIMGRLGPKERRFLAEILYGFITRNYQRVAEVHFEAGYVPSTQRVADFAQAIRAIG